MVSMTGITVYLLFDNFRSGPPDGRLLIDQPIDVMFAALGSGGTAGLTGNLKVASLIPGTS